MIYISKPSIISSAGISAEENFLNFQKGERFLSVCEGYKSDKSFILGVVKTLENFSPNTPKSFQTRTNAILLTAFNEIGSQIEKAIKKYGKNRVGVVIGTTTSGVEENYEIFKDYASSGVFDIQRYDINQNSLANPAEFITHYYDLKSVCFCISTACTSGVKAIIEAKRLICAGICDAVICGGVDSLNTLTINGFDSLGILSTSPTIPFSKNRDGINIGEGAGIFVLSRDKISDVIVAGEFSNCDAFHMTQPETSGKMQILCTKNALNLAGLSGVDYLNLHGTGTKANDEAEALVVNAVLNQTPASSIKPIIGHTLAAAGAIESGVCVLACMQHHTTLPPHIYDGQYDESIKRINLVKMNEKSVVNSAMSLSFAFGGDNAAIVFKRI